MTINTYKALSKISTILVTSAMLTFPTVKASHAEITFDDGHSLTVCFLDGGDVVGNSTHSGCRNPKTGATTVCDKSKAGDVDQCSTDDHAEGRPTGGRLSKPILNGGGGTMIMQPDTNTTVGTGAKPLGGKLIMRNVLRK